MGGPSAIIADGPPTYIFGFMVNRINLERSLENMCRVVEESGAELIIYDHHLLRESRYLERTARVWERARDKGKRMLTAAEALGGRPLILTLGEGKG